MPNRIIREDLIESDRYQSLSMEAKLCFVHLLLLADDFGCVSVSPGFLRRRCLLNTQSDERIGRILMELVDVDLIRTYEVDRHCLAFIPRYRQRLQRSTLKHEKPPESLYIDDPDARTKFNNINGNNQYSTVGQRLGNGSPTDVQQTKRREGKGSEPSKPPNPLNAATWEAYSAAYAFRYGTGPVRNASVNSCIAHIVKRLGNDAPQVAAFFLTHNDQWYVKKRHPVASLLADCEGLRTQWKTGRKSTGLEARSAEQKDAVVEQINRVTANIERRENAKKRID